MVIAHAGYRSGEQEILCRLKEVRGQPAVACFADDSPCETILHPPMKDLAVAFGTFNNPVRPPKSLGPTWEVLSRIAFD